MPRGPHKGVFTDTGDRYEVGPREIDLSCAAEIEAVDWYGTGGPPFRSGGATSALWCPGQSSQPHDGRVGRRSCTRRPGHKGPHICATPGGSADGFTDFPNGALLLRWGWET